MSYTKQTWQTGDVITATKLNHMEDGIEAVETEMTDDYARTDGAYEGMTVGNAEQLVATVGIEDSVPYTFRTSGGSADIGDRETDMLVGGTIAWNQLIKGGDFASADDWDGGTTVAFSVSGNVASCLASAQWAKVKQAGANDLTLKPGHKYLATAEMKGTTNNYFEFGTLAAKYLTANDTWTQFAVIVAPNTAAYVRMAFGDKSTSDFATYYVRNAMTFDLTQMFGSAIADYIYSLEQANAGAGVAFFRKQFPKPYYDYNAGELLSVNASAHKTVGFNAYNHATGKAKLVCGMPYQITGAYSALTMDGEAITPDAGGYFTSANSGELTVTGGDSATTCVHLVWDGERDGEYEPYVEHTYPLDSSLTLRGIPKLSADNTLYYDGDTYESDGTVTRKYGVVDLGTLNWSAWEQNGSLIFNATVTDKKPTRSDPCITQKYTYNPNIVSSWNDLLDKQITGQLGGTQVYIRDTDYADVAAFKAALSGVSLVYELATPTEEEADTYQNPQIVDDFGTEEYIVTEQSGVAVPVGHETTYQANLRAKLEMAPDSPDGNGDYIVRQSNGQNSYVPITFPADELPAAPTTDGNYVLKCTVSNGTATFTWATA